MRGMKEAHILNTPGTSTAHIPFVKMFMVLPVSALLGSFYLLVKQRYGLLKAYFAVLLTILSYFTLYAFVISPHMTYFVPSPQALLSLQQRFPSQQFMLTLLGIWPSALFYTMGEMWGMFSLLILFWQMANEIFTTEEAKLCYPALQLVGSIALIAASFIIKIISNTTQPLQACVLFMSVLCLSILSLVYTLKDFISQKNTDTVKKAKKGMVESFTIALKTPYIMYLTICICAFGVLASIFDYSVKEVMSKFYPGENGYLHYYSIFTNLKGWLALFANLFTLYYLRSLGWFFMAMLTPIICIVSANMFLTTSTLHQMHITFSSGVSDYWYAWTCCFAVILIYAAKYAFFDTTKEMAFIPLPNDIKTNGKAAVDGIGGRVGKSGSGLLQIAIFQITGLQTYEATAPYMLAVCLVVSVVWTWALIQLNQCYQKQIVDSNAHKEPITDSGFLTESTEKPQQVLTTA